MHISVVIAVLVDITAAERLSEVLRRSGAEG